MAAKKKSKKKVAAAPKRSAAKKKAPARKAAAKSPARRAAKKVKHPVVHWEIQSQDPSRLHRFYAEAFGWSIDVNNPMKYGMVSSGRDAGGIDGGIGGTQAPGSRVVVYTQVPSIDDVLSRISAGGGRTVMPRTDIGPVIMALYEDPEGNTMGLIEG
jgi:predicted enzyme related to lactoylglutathione lyase